MSEDAIFRGLMARIRSGDPKAAAELVRLYEPEIRRAIRARLTDPRLRRTVDSADICQSVLGSFFVRAAMGQYDLEQPESLIKLLITMARHHICDEARRQKSDRRDVRRTEPANTAVLGGLAAPTDTPSEIVAAGELLEAARRNLSEEERFIAGERAAGKDWNEIAGALNDNADAVRKRLSRAVDRVTRALGLDDLADD